MLIIIVTTQTFVLYKINFKICVLKKTVAIPHVSHFFIIMFESTFNSNVNNEFAINLAQLRNCNILDLFFVISPPFFQFL